MAFKINGIKVKNPSTFKIERYNITTMERLSNGDMTGDFVNSKLKFYFTYESITAEDFDKILSAIWDNGHKIFFPFEYEDRGKTKKCTVYVGSIPSDLHYMGKKTTTWKGVTFNLIER